MSSSASGKGDNVTKKKKNFFFVVYKIENYTSLKLENPKPVFFQEPSGCVCEDVLLYPVDK